MFSSLKWFLCFVVVISSTVGTFANPTEIKLVNATDKPIVNVRLGYVGGGVDIWAPSYGPFTIAPGATASAYVAWADGSSGGTDYIDYSWKILANATTVVGNSYVISDGDATAFTISGGSAGPYDDVKTTTIHTNPNIKQPTDDAAKTAWKVTDTTLTADLFREGVDKVVAAAPAANSGGSSSGESVDVGFIATQQRNWLEHGPENEAGLADGAYLNDKMTEGAEAASALNAAIDAAASSHVLTPEDFAPGTGGDASGLVWTFDLHHRTFSFDFNPAHNEKVDSLVTFMKALMAWAIVILFEWFLWTEFRLYLMAGLKAVPAKGNPVVGGTGAQITSAVVAGLITAVIFTIPTAFWAAADSGMTWAVGISHVNPIAGSWDARINLGIYLAKYAFPLATACSATASAFVVRKFGLLILTGVATLIRFFIA